jgi:RimJ/RimL family protein N-acetyltransferase
MQATRLPELQTERLYLRPFALADAAEVQRLAGEWVVAFTTTNIPHPYEDGMAEAWIGTHRSLFAQGRGLTLAVERREDGRLVGAIGLTDIVQQHDRAEMGYWIGHPYWGNGYATEAARAILDYGFTELKLNRIFARHLVRNPASGRVMEKIGMTYEGCLRQHVKKWGVYEDVAFYGVLRAHTD